MKIIETLSLRLSIISIILFSFILSKEMVTSSNIKILSSFTNSLAINILYFCLYKNFDPLVPTK